MTLRRSPTRSLRRLAGLLSFTLSAVTCWTPTARTEYQPYGATALAGHLLFVACYAFIHHGLPLLVLSKLDQATKPQPATAYCI